MFTVLFLEAQEYCSLLSLFSRHAHQHFTQSYTLQVQWILEAVFARLGVKHQARNFGNGGMSTEHNVRC